MAGGGCAKARLRTFGSAKPTPVACQPSALDNWASAAADDLQATIEYLAKRPDADPNKVIVIGDVNAGMAAVALSARNPHGLVGAISIAGGLQAESGCPLNDILVNAYRDYGTTSRVPNLWLYSQKDTIFTPALTERMHAAFLDGGGDVKFIMFRLSGNVGTGIFSDARESWYAQMDGFLRALQLPTWTEDDVKELVKKLNITEARATEDTMGKLGDGYLSAPGEKALAYSAIPATPTTPNAPAKARLWMWSAAPTLEIARNSALAACQKQASGCVIVMENNRWVGGMP